jgi:cytoskeletal protein RodZ
MTDPGLTNRLRQHSRRSGFMVGLTMAVTIALCIVGFIWVFTELEPYVSDFVHRDPSSAQEQESPRQTPRAQAAEDEPEPTEEESDAPPPEKAEPTPTPKPKPTATSEAFNPDYQLTSDNSVNLRSGPGVANNVITTVEIASPLQYLGEEEVSTNPVDDGLDEGQSWMKFKTEDGDVGWIREIDVEPFSD